MTDPFKEQADRALSSLHLNDWEKHCLFTAAMEEKKMKKKMPAVLIIAVILIITLGGVTMADSLNIFALFTNYDARLEKVIHSSVIKDPVPVQVETDYIGTSYVTLTNAHFDDDHLIVGFSVENMVAAESFIPTEEELARMRPQGLGYACSIPWINTEQQVLNNWYKRAVQTRLPTSCGIKASEITVNFVISGENGETYHMDSRQLQELQADGLMCYLYYLNGKNDPFIRKLAEQDEIRIEMRIYECTYRLWYNGEEQYARWVNELITAVPITLEKSYQSLKQ